jgi:hypothetical protein
MGTLNCARDGKDRVEAAPVEEAGAARTRPDFEPIAGVALDQFAAVSKGIAAYNYDRSRLAEMAAARGIDPVSWEAASQGWTSRIRASPAIAQEFNQLYRAS